MLDPNAIFSREQKAGYDPDILRLARFLFIGAGGLGSNASLFAVLSGVGTVYLTDRDFLEPHNLTRNPLYPRNPERYHFEKARANASALADLQPDPQGGGIYFAHDWIEDLGDGAFAGMTVVFSCVDSAEGRGYASDLACLHGVPLVEGGFDDADATMSVFPNVRSAAAASPCWHCSHSPAEGSSPCTLYARKIEEAGFIPNTETVAAMLAAFMTEAGIQLALGRPWLAGKTLDMNVRTGRSRLITQARDPRCPGVHRAYPESLPIIELSPEATLEELLDEAASLFGGRCDLGLPSPLYFDVPCRECGKLARTAQPLHRWRRGGTCIECGGSSPLAPSKAFTRIYPAISADLPQEVISLTGRAAGLNFGTVVELADDGGRTLYARLRGGRDDLFQQARRTSDAGA